MGKFQRKLRKKLKLKPSISICQAAWPAYNMQQTVTLWSVVGENPTPYAGPGGFMGYGDLWGINLIVLILYKSSLGFMGIYITLGLSTDDKSP